MIESVRDIPEVLGTYTSNQVSNMDFLTGLSIVMLGVIVLIGIFILIAIYIFSAIALRKIAKRLGEENSWMAWVPFLNIYLLLKMGDISTEAMIAFWVAMFIQAIPSLPGMKIVIFLLTLAGGLTIQVIYVIAYMRLSEKIGFNKLLGLIALTQIGHPVLLGILAWGNQNSNSEDSISKHQEV